MRDVGLFVQSLEVSYVASVWRAFVIYYIKKYQNLTLYLFYEVYLFIGYVTGDLDLKITK